MNPKKNYLKPVKEQIERKPKKQVNKKPSVKNKEVNIDETQRNT